MSAAASSSASATRFRSTRRLGYAGSTSFSFLTNRPAGCSSSRGRQLNLSFIPLRPQHGIRNKADPSARALIVFHDPADTLAIDPKSIAQLHGLTPAEAQLAAALAEGASLAQYASGRGCSEQTARTHLKRVLDKTGTRRQADLVRVLMSSAALHLAQPD